MWKETMLSSVIIALLLLFINPLDVFGMPSASQMILLGVFAVLFMIFIAFVWQEHPADERESHHVFLAGRMAFLVGSGVLACGIIVQLSLHALDVWLPIALGSMLLSKMATLMYVRTKC